MSCSKAPGGYGPAPPRRAPCLAPGQRHLGDPAAMPLGLVVPQVQGPRPALDRGVVGQLQLLVGAAQVLEQRGVVDGDGRLPGQHRGEGQPLGVGLRRRATEALQHALDPALGHERDGMVGYETLRDQPALGGPLTGAWARSGTKSGMPTRTTRPDNPSGSLASRPRASKGIPGAPTNSRRPPPRRRSGCRPRRLPTGRSPPPPPGRGPDPGRGCW